MLEKLNYDKIDNLKKESKPIKSQTFHVEAKGNQKCLICKDNHPIFKCPTFLSLSEKERFDKVKILKLCINCFRSNHFTNNCLANGCRICNKKHNTLLHIKKIEKIESNIETPLAMEPSTSNSFAGSSGSANSCSNVLLSTAIVKLKGKDGKWHNCKALLDSGSQSNIITQNFVNKLDLPIKKADVIVTGIGESKKAISAGVDVTFASRNQEYSKDIFCLVMDKITNNLSSPINSNIISISPKYKLADPFFDRNNPIELLIGGSNFWLLITNGQIKLNNTNLVMQNTVLGWIIAGPVPIVSNLNVVSVNHSVCSEKGEVNVLKDQLEKFWKLEEINDINSNIKHYCEIHFTKNTKHINNQFIVKLPLKTDPKNLGESYTLAKNRFYSLERKLIKNPDLYCNYKKFMQEYLDLGHMAEVKGIENADNEYFIPHHAVIRETSLTTKTRVVFDASMKTTNDLSLNDIQHVGPTIQNELFSIITRFRIHQYVMTADISKMYRMIAIDKSQRPLQQIFWRFNAEDVLKTYHLNTVTYGMASLAIRCLIEIANKNQDQYPKAAEIIRNDF